MSDCDETDFFWESWTSPGKRKRKNDSKKDKKYLKWKNNITMKTDQNILKKKKKKKSKFKEALEGKKAKIKDKKKKKNRLELDDSFIFTQVSDAEAKPAVKPETLNPRGNDELKPDHLTQDSKKKTKRKKRVAFDLSPGYIRVKRPKFVSSSQCPKESIVFENEAVRDSQSCSQVMVTGNSLGSTHDNDSQCTSEDINSQDLFITQKTFRASPSVPSSGEASDKDVVTTPQTQQEELHTSVAQIKEHLEGSDKCSQDSLFDQHHRKTIKHKKEPAQVILIEEEEEERLNKALHENKEGKRYFQTQMELNLTREKKIACPLHIKPSVMNPFLAEPIVVNPSLDIAESKQHACTSSQQSTVSTSTQTENLFTTELSFYLSFCRKTQAATHFGDLKALDLSLPERARKDIGICLSVKTSPLPGQIKSDTHKDLHPSCSSGMKDVEEKKQSSGRHPCSVSTQSKGETTLSPQSESEPKSADTTTSSEDNEPPCRTGKLDLTQVRAVQMKLNESFFFKTKGEGQSPRPESPLMKLAQGRDVKSRKGH